ncbi:MAG: DNA methyltransferase, partial [Candidatus Poribacteria bacterium]
SGTTAVAAKRLGKNYIGIDLNEKYVNIAEKRLRKIDEKTRSGLFITKENVQMETRLL